MKTLLKTIQRAGILFLLISYSSLCYAQSGMQVSGTIRDADTKAPIPYATIALLALPDSSIVAGTISDEAGNFSIEYRKGQNYLINIRCMGFTPLSKQIGQTQLQETLTCYLKPRAVAMEALVVKANRKKAKTENHKTTYYVNSKMAEASHNGVDLLKQVPGVFIDLNQKVTLQGSDKVLILVDGHERDVQFIQQLTAGQVNKVSLETPPGPQYDANLSGVVHIQTKKRSTGIRGHVNLELPTSANMVYLNPTYSLGYAHKRFNLFTSYTGIISQFAINEYRSQEQFASGESQNLSFTENVRQDNKNHRFNIGMDFRPSERNQFNVLAFYNPYSNEHDGSAFFQSTKGNNLNNYWQGARRDKDQNHRLFYSLFYKHNFNKHTHLQFDASQFYFRGLNQTSYQSDSSSTAAITLPGTNLAPSQNSTFLKADFKTQVEEQLHLSTGTKFSFIHRQDGELASYYFSENRQALYADLSWQVAKLHISGGARYEHYRMNSNETAEYRHHLFMPSFQIQWQYTSKSSL
ncbi:MAG: TonB-dependent receptor, partial [Bacteroidales bacterium]